MSRRGSLADVGGPRTVEVDPSRIVRWVEGFTERHGEPSWSPAPDAPDVVRLSAPDGAVAELHVWPRPAAAAARGGRTVAAPRNREELAPWAQPPSPIGLVLVRRGGYALGLADGERLVQHHCGTRYVQSRTAAGGWSQQRFARRRGNQADALVEAVAARAVDLLLPVVPAALVVGGDRALGRQVLERQGLAALAELPRRTLHDLPDPRLAVLQNAVKRGRAVRVVISGD